MSLNNCNLLLAHIEKEKDTVFFEITDKGIDFINQKLNRFSQENEICFNKSDLGFNEILIKSEEQISKIIFKYKKLDNENLILNFDPNHKILHIYCSDKGVKEFKDSLACLREHIEKKQLEDISYMIEEWGGNYLLNEKISEEFSVICHLRLYGIV